jgi:hypothetical protein
MKDLFRLATLCVATIPLAGWCQAGPITTFTFTGTCFDCTGQGTGTLVLQNYTPGTALQTSNFVSFFYTSNLITVEANSLNNLVGMLPASLPDAADVTMDQLVVTPSCRFNCTTYDFNSANFDNNQWSMGIDDEGTNGIWSAATTAGTVPEPGSLTMLATGLAGLGALKLRRRLLARPVS